MDIFCDNVLYNVLLRLPARILHERMRYVCKQWFRIITDPSFVYSHLNLSRSRPGLLFEIDGGRSGSTIIMDNDGQVVQQVRVDTTSVLGCCNGLLLLRRMVVKNSRFKWPCNVEVYNPVTRRRTSLPPISCKHPSGLDGGIGFDQSVKAYKVAVFFGINDTWNCKVLTLASRQRCQWRSVRDLPPMHMFYTKMISVGGSVNWVNYYASDIFHIMSMDICDEKFRRIDVVEGMLDRGSYSWLMGTGDGKLAISVSSSVCLAIETWVLEDKLWTQRFTVPDFKDKDLSFSKWELLASGMGNMCGEEVIFFQRRKYEVNSRRTSYFNCNMKNGTVVRLIDFSNHGRGSSYYVHIDSLVSW